jgi:hypothetical protein
MRFTELRRTGLPVVEENDRAERRFPVLVEQSRLRLWRPGEPVAAGRRLLVGAATWSVYDLSLLDVLDDALARDEAALGRIDVFDVDRVGRVGFEDYIPGLGKVVGTPVAGLWIDGILGERDFGRRAITLISGLFGHTLKRNAAEWRWDVDRRR